MPEHIVIGREAAPRHSNEMEAVELQVFDQCMKIFRDGAGLGTGVRIRETAAPAAPIESNDPIARLDKARNVVLPAVGVAGVGVKQHDPYTIAAAVRVPKTHA